MRWATDNHCHGGSRVSFNVSPCKGGHLHGRSACRPREHTPLAEFNFHADVLAACFILGLTSPTPSSTMPPLTAAKFGVSSKPPLFSANWPSRPLPMLLFPLDVTERHPHRKDTYATFIAPYIERGSPLAQWHSAFMSATYQEVESLGPYCKESAPSIVLHDVLCIWYVAQSCSKRTSWTISEPQDIRVKPSGQWSRGGCVTDRRSQRRETDVALLEDHGRERTAGADSWLNKRTGNRVKVCVGTPEGEWPTVVRSSVLRIWVLFLANRVQIASWHDFQRTGLSFVIATKHLQDAVDQSLSRSNVHLVEKSLHCEIRVTIHEQISGELCYLWGM